MLKQLLIIGSIALAAFFGAAISFSQETEQKIDAGAQAKVDGAADANFEVLTRGPVHEAFATKYQTTASAGITVDREPPAVIDEVPPPVRPEGESVTWIPGYWGWDADSGDFLWVSGTYRNAPPNHRWTPGYWSKVENGYQWMSGFWIAADVESLNYYSPPPDSLERGPSSPAPGEDYFWAPGSYVPQGEKYAWQPGYWVPYQANYVWNPGRNVPTRGGYIYVPGYWDHRLDLRGALFAPVRLRAAAAANTNLRLTPSTILPFSALQYHLFGRTDSSAYYFGDYYDERYTSQGYRPWYQSQYVKGVPDPLFGYYDWVYGRGGADYGRTLGTWNNYFTTNAALRPAATLAAQLDLAKTNADVKNLTASLLGTPILGDNQSVPNGFVRLSAADQTAINTSLRDLRLLSDNRLKLESAVPGIANAGAAANTAVRIAAAPLTLPRVNVPVVRSVPAAPAQIVRGVGNAVGGVGRAVNGVVPGVIPGGAPLPGVLPGGPGGVLPGVLPGGPGGGLLPRGGDDGDRGGGGLLPIP
jgi:hypothetical protein